MNTDEFKERTKKVSKAAKNFFPNCNIKTHTSIYEQSTKITLSSPNPKIANSFLKDPTTTKLHFELAAMIHYPNPMNVSSAYTKFTKGGGILEIIIKPKNPTTYNILQNNAEATLNITDTPDGLGCTISFNINDPIMTGGLTHQNIKKAFENTLKHISI